MLSIDGFRGLSACMYVLFAAGVLWLGFLHHHSKIHGQAQVNQYPKGYFTLLAIQLVPLLVTGFVIADTYIIGTRLATLAVVLVVFAMVSSIDGTFANWRYRLGSVVVLGIAVLGPMLWTQSEVVRTFVHDWEAYIAWGSVAMMLLFVFAGQRVVARELFHHFLSGNYSVKRLWLQIIRFFGFFFQAVAYWLVPSKAEPLLGLDPIFLQGAIGALGVGFILVRALMGFVLGSGERRQKRKERIRASNEATLLVVSEALK